jgi:hypothetical protein
MVEEHQTPLWEKHMSHPITRRDFAKTSVAAVVGLGSLTGLAPLSPASAEDTKLLPEDVRLTDDIEPLVRLIEATPRERIVGTMIEQLRKGMNYRQLLAAMFLASTRMAVSPHHFYMIHAAHQLSLNVSHEDRLLPLFWALDTLPYGRTDGKTRFPKMSLSMAPSAGTAAADFERAMAQFDPERAEVALLVLVRSEGTKRAMSRLWHYAGRAHDDIGHPAIGLANGWRTLETIGWQHAESVCQYGARMFCWAKEPSRLFPLNVHRSAQAIKSAPADWAGSRADEQATRELFAVIRQGNADDACQWTFEALTRGNVQARSVWDAVFLASAEFMVRYASPDTIVGQPHASLDAIGGRPLHLNTTENALAYAFGACGESQTQFYLLLQAVERAAEFIDTEKNRNRLRDLKLIEITDVESPASPKQAVEEIFSQQLVKRYDADQKRFLSDHAGTREEMDRVMRLTLAFARKHANHRPFLETARRLVCLKATQNAHDVKFPSAIFENYELAGRQWRPYLLAASVHWLHGVKMPDNPAVLSARDALRM